MTESGAGAPPLVDRSILPTLAAAVSALIALSVLAGWTFGIASLRSLLPGAVEMKVNTAIGLLCSALALFVLSSRPHPRREVPGQLLGLFVALIGLATLSEYVFEWDLGIDELIFRDTAHAYNVIPGRMSPYSAVAFACVGLALASLPWRALAPFAWVAAAAVTFIGALSMLGYIWRAGELITDRWLPPVAAHTAVAFVLLGAGTLGASLRASRAGEPQDVPASMVERFVLGAFVGALALIFTAAAFTYRAGADLADSAGVVAYSQQLRQAARQLYGAASNAELAHRAYLLTGERGLRLQYLAFADETRRHGHTLRRLTVDDAGQQKNVRELQSLVDDRMQALFRQVSVYDAQGAAAAKTLVAQAPGTERAQAMWTTAEVIHAAEMKRVTEREAELARTRLLTLVLLVLTMVVATGVLLVLYRAIRREMAARMRYEHALTAANRRISEDVAELKRRETEILGLNKALEDRAAQVEAASKELETFSYSVSHDLRAPLRHVDGYLRLLSEAMQGKLEEEPRRYMTVIAQASRQMGQLIDDLLAFSRMTRADMHDARVDLNSIVTNAVASLETAARGRNVEWRVDDLPGAEGDPAMLRQVYMNLLGNALKYSAPRDPACIEAGTAGTESDRTIFFVRDNGVGFDMKYASKLFGVFQRLHRAEEFEGTGIGLATVQRIIARHGGRVWAESTLGEGATFYFTLKTSADQHHSPATETV